MVFEIPPPTGITTSSGFQWRAINEQEHKFKRAARDAPVHMGAVPLSRSRSACSLRVSHIGLGIVKTPGPSESLNPESRRPPDAELRIVRFAGNGPLLHKTVLPVILFLTRLPSIFLDTRKAIKWRRKKIKDSDVASPFWPIFMGTPSCRTLFPLGKAARCCSLDRTRFRTLVVVKPKKENQYHLRPICSPAA